MKASKLFCATAALCLAAAAARAETIKFTNFTPDTMGGETWQPGAGEAAPDAYFFYVDYATKYGGIRTSHYYMRHVRSIGGPDTWRAFNRFCGAQKKIVFTKKRA